MLPKRIDTWSLTYLQQRLVKTGGRLAKHARYYRLLLAESHLIRPLLGAMLRDVNPADGASEPEASRKGAWCKMLPAGTAQMEVPVYAGVDRESPTTPRTFVLAVGVVITGVVLPSVAPGTVRAGAIAAE